MLARCVNYTALQHSLILMAGDSNGNAGADEAAESGDVMDALKESGGEESPMAAAMNISSTVHDYGMTGDVVIRTYKKN